MGDHYREGGRTNERTNEQEEKVGHFERRGITEAIRGSFSCNVEGVLEGVVIGVSKYRR